MTHEPECQKADLGCGQYPCVEVCICDALSAAYRRGMGKAAEIAENRYNDMRVCNKPDDCQDLALGAWLVSEDIKFMIENGDYADVVRNLRHEEQSFKELIQHTQELGLYDLDSAEIVRDMRNRDNEIDNEY